MRLLVRWWLPGAVVVVAVVVVVTVLVATGGSSTPVPSVIPKLPVLGTATDVFDGDFGDPFILKPAAGAYVMFGTDDPPDHIPMATSPDGQTWTQGPDAVPVLPRWAGPDPHDSHVWAPAAVKTSRGYMLYITVPDAASGRECIAALTSPSPTGPYADAIGHALVCQVDLGGSIDPSVVQSSGLHLAWKSDGNCCGQPAILWQQDLRGDGLAVTGQPHRLLTATQPWQAGIIENPAMIPAHGGGWWLFYSGNRFDAAAYATGLAWCPTLGGECRETSTGPYLSGTATQFSPGGLDFFRDGKGAMWASFATWNRPPRNGRFFCCRSVNTAALLSS
jgi:hypothetical protein